MFFAIFNTRTLSLKLALSLAFIAGASCQSASAEQINSDFVPPEITLPMQNNYAAQAAAAQAAAAAAQAASGGNNGGASAAALGNTPAPGLIGANGSSATSNQSFMNNGANSVPGLSSTPGQPNPFMMKATDRMRLPPGTSIPSRGSSAPVAGQPMIPGYPNAGSGSQLGGPPQGSSAFMQPGQMPPGAGTPLQRQLNAQGQMMGQGQGQPGQQVGQPQAQPQGQQAGGQNGKGDPVVTVQTNKGNIVMRLFPQHAPITCKAFIQMVKSGFYNGLTFHRVEPGFVIQGGCPNGNGTGNYIAPGQSKPRFLPLETSPYARHNAAGVVAMARQSHDQNSASCQFYITLGPKAQLDNKYTVFGGVIQGMDVVQRIAIGDRILSVSASE
jgi:peptidyl-prolyl cis-trans isomerase B (cyclophilin B)